jgi:hypothetical protein
VKGVKKKIRDREIMVKERKSNMFKKKKKRRRKVMMVIKREK